MRAAEGLGVAGALPFSGDDRAAVATGSLEHAERKRVDMGYGKRSGFRRGRCQVRSRLETTEEVRLLEHDGCGVLGGCRDGGGIRDASGVRHLDDLETEARRIRLHDLAHLRVRRLGDDDPRTAGDVLRHVAGVGGDRRPVVPGRVRDVHAGQLADRRLVLEDRLQHALAELRLIRGVRSEELSARRGVLTTAGT